MKIRIFIIICFYLTIGCSKKEVKINENDEKIETIIHSLENNFNADINWERKLSRESKFRTEQILSIELHDLWINRDIIFFGEIVDISKKDSTNNSIIIKRGLYPLTHNKYPTDLTLKLVFNPTNQENLSNSEEYKNLLGYNKYVVVVARITEIKSNTYYEENNEYYEKIGLGDLVYLESISKY